MTKSANYLTLYLEIEIHLMNSKPYLYYLPVFCLLFSTALSQSTHHDYLDSLENEFRYDRSPEELALTLADMGRSHIVIDINKTFALVHRALKLSDSLNYKLGRAHALRTLGSAMGETKNYTQGVQMLLEALEIFTAKKDRIGQANCYLSLGSLHRHGMDFNQALIYEKKAFKIYMEEGNAERLGVIYNNLGRTLSRMESYDSAIYYLKQAIKINEGANPLVLSSNYCNLGIVYRMENKKKEARYYLNKVMTLSDSLGAHANTRACAESHLILGDMAVEDNDYEQADLHFHQAISLARTRGHIDILHRSYSSLFDMLSTIGEYRKGSDVLKEFVALTDSILVLERKNRLEMVQWYYQNSVQKSQVNLLQHEQTLSEKIISRQKNSILLLMVVVISAILLIVVSVRNARRQKRLREKLEVANSTKNKLFSIISHDFRSPINTILGASTFLKNNVDKLSTGDLRILFTDMHKSILNTLKFTENILTWARSQMDVIKLNPVLTNMQDVINSALSVIGDRAKEKGINIDCHIDQGLHVMADKNQLETVLRNLINNAVKFSEAGDSVDIRASRNSNMVEVTVADTGVGMDEVMKSKLFRIDSKNSTKGTAGEIGTGLGLIICKEFVENNHGQLYVESEPGKGSRFIFTLPYAKKEVTLNPEPH